MKSFPTIQFLFLFCLGIFYLKTIPGDATESEHCPFHNIDIFVACGKDNLPLLPFLLNSISKFMHCSHRINLVIDRPDIPRALLWYTENIKGHHVHLHPFDYPASVPTITNSKDSSSRPGYILQAWVMMWADQYSDNSEVDYVMFMDVDSILAMPVTCASLFDKEGRPYMQSWAMEPFHAQFKPPCLAMLGTDCDRSYMAMFPFIMPMNAFQPMRDHIRNRINPQLKTFDEAFEEWAKNNKWSQFSQFVIMGEYVRFHQPHLVHQIFCPHLGKGFGQSPDHKACEQYVPPGIHYGWPYQFYLLQRSGTVPYFTAGQMRMSGDSAFHQQLVVTNKYSPQMILHLENVVLHGHCLQYFFKHGTVHTELGCTEGMTTSIHPSIDLYYKLRPVDWQRVVEVYSGKNVVLSGGKCASRIDIKAAPAAATNTSSS